MRWMIALWIWAGLAAADPVVDQLETGFDRWTAEQGIAKGTLAIFKNGDLVNAPDPSPVELASLSKAITAVCVMHLVDEGRLGYGTTVNGLLGKGPESLTVAQLLTHSGGILPQDYSDAWWSNKHYGGDRPMHGELTDMVFERDNRFLRSGRYVYSNANYAILAVMIEAATGRSYQRACSDRVFDPAGVRGIPSTKTLPFLAWGGWTMSVEDYGRFHHHYFGPDGEIGRDPLAYPHTELMLGELYGMGMSMSGYNNTGSSFFDTGRGMSHFGAYCFPFRMNVGSKVQSWGDTWTVVAAYDACLDQQQFIALATVFQPLDDRQ